MNKVILMGRLVADPEFSMSQSNAAVCKFRIAVDRAYAKQGEEKQADFLYIITFGKTAEFVSKWFTKGKPILVEGRIQNNNYQDNNGVMQYHNQIIADNVSFILSDPTRNGNTGNQQPVQQNQPNNGYPGNQDGYNQQYAPPVQNQPYQQNNGYQNYQQAPAVQQNNDDFAGFENIISDGNLPF